MQICPYEAIIFRLARNKDEPLPCEVKPPTEPRATRPPHPTPPPFTMTEVVNIMVRRFTTSMKTIYIEVLKDITSSNLFTEIVRDGDMLPPISVINGNRYLYTALNSHGANEILVSQDDKPSTPTSWLPLTTRAQ